MAALVFAPLVFAVVLDAGWTLLTLALGVRDGPSVRDGFGVRDGLGGRAGGERDVLLTVVPLGLVVLAGLAGWIVGRRAVRTGIRPGWSAPGVLGLAVTLWPVHLLYEMGAAPWAVAGAAFTVLLVVAGAAAGALAARGRAVLAALVATVGGLVAVDVAVTLRIYLDNVLRSSAPAEAFAKPTLATDALWWFPASVVDPMVDLGFGAYWDTPAVAGESPLAPLHPFTHLLLAAAAFGLALTLAAARQRGRTVDQPSPELVRAD